MHFSEETHTQGTETDEGPETEEGPEIYEGPKAGTSGEKEKVCKRRKKSKGIILDEEVQGQLVEWYQANRCLYDKREKRYRDVSYKRRIMEEKAKEVGVTCKSQKVKFMHKV